MRSSIVPCAASTIGASDARLLAYAIMPNHLHLVIIQGEWPLDRVMQPILRRVALLVQRAHATTGHVFERRFRDRPCMDPDHVRNAIVYTHLNPVRAGLVDDPAEYRWSSHGEYATGGGEPNQLSDILAVDHALPLFAPRDAVSLSERRRAYERHVASRVQRDDYAAEAALGRAVGLPPAPPPVLSGDMYWARMFTAAFRVAPRWWDTDERPHSRPHELREIAVHTLTELAPGLDLERVRSSDKSRAVVAVRRTMVVRMRAAGHRGSAIARFLRVSDQCVSNILVDHRRGRSPT